MADVGGQMSEVGGPKSEDGGRRTEGRCQRLARLWQVRCRRSVISRRRTLTRTDVYHPFASLTRDAEDTE
ncbi:hypothetical protein D3OALGA1CA_5058 [Olavius algarvensis associated proteobacterium Delta 3]|nr:hypothetical protein D3OALGA1CA_5058 [Olavius algarvensis associated proteobacterium Delta 3]